MVAWALTTLSSLFFYVTGLLVFLTPLPLLFLGYRKGLKATVPVVVFSVIILMGLYYLQGSWLQFLPFSHLLQSLSLFQVQIVSLHYYLFYALMALLSLWMSREGHSLERDFLLILGVALGAPVFSLFVFASLVGMHPVEEFRLAVRLLMDQMIELQEAAHLSGMELTFLKNHRDELVEKMIRLVPAVWGGLGALVLALNLYLARRWNPRLKKKPFAHWTDFARWKFDERVIWVPIVLGALFFINTYLVRQAWFSSVLLNLILLCTGLYFFQGMSVVIWFFREKLSPFMKIFGYVTLLLFSQVAVFAIMVFGVLDFWFDFRKLSKQTVK